MRSWRSVSDFAKAAEAEIFGKVDEFIGDVKVISID